MHGQPHIRFFSKYQEMYLTVYTVRKEGILGVKGQAPSSHVLGSLRRMNFIVYSALLLTNIQTEILFGGTEIHDHDFCC